MDYTLNDIKDAYKKIGVEKDSVISLKTDIRWLGRFENSDKISVLQAHYKVLSDVVDLTKGTIVVSTASTYLCNTDVPFDLAKTKSERGVLTEYLRTSNGAIRSFHPFMSYTAIGKDADEICKNVSRHAYGPETPKHRLIEKDALCISIGLHPRLTCSTVHHVEYLMGVPYRYVKEFYHPVVRDGKIQLEPFYLYVWYKACNIRKNKNKKIFDKFNRDGYSVTIAPLGRGKVYAYSMRDFFRSAIQAFKHDIYVWLDSPPIHRPYQT